MCKGVSVPAGSDPAGRIGWQLSVKRTRYKAERRERSLNVHLESSSFQDATDRIKYYRKTADALAHINLSEHPVSPSNMSRISAFHIWTSQGLD